MAAHPEPGNRRIRTDGENQVEGGARGRGPGPGPRVGICHMMKCYINDTCNVDTDIAYKQLDLNGLSSQS